MPYILPALASNETSAQIGTDSLIDVLRQWYLRQASVRGLELAALIMAWEQVILLYDCLLFVFRASLKLHVM